MTPFQMSLNIEIKTIRKTVEEHSIEMETFKDALKMFRETLDQFKLSGIYDLQNNKKIAEGYLRELLRMQKLDHVRVQVSQRQSISQNPAFNKTVDFASASFNQYSIDNESLT